MTDEERRQRIETLLLAVKDWCEESDDFLVRITREMCDLRMEFSDRPATDTIHSHIANERIRIGKLHNSIDSRLLDWGDPSKHEAKVQQRADNQRSKKE